MEAQVQSPWRKEPKLIQAGFSLFLFVFVLTVSYIFILNSMTSSMMDKFVFSSSEYRTAKLFSLIYDPLAFDSTMVMSLIVMILCNIFFSSSLLSLKTAFYEYIHPIKYPSLIGYSFWVACGIFLFLMGARPILIDNLHFFDYFTKEIILSFSSPLVFLMAIEWDHFKTDFFFSAAFWVDWKSRLKYLSFSLCYLVIMLGAGALTGLIYECSWNIAVALNEGEMPFYGIIPQFILIVSSMLSSFLLVVILYVLVPFIPNKLDKPWRRNALNIGIISVVSVTLGFVIIYILANHLTGSNQATITHATGLSYMPNNNKTMIILNSLEDDKTGIKVTSQNYNFKLTFANTNICPINFKNGETSYTISEENLKRVEDYLKSGTYLGALANPARMFLAFGHLLMLEPEKGSFWLHEAAKRNGVGTARVLDISRLHFMPIRPPYITYLVSYLDQSNWHIGSCQKIKMARTLMHFDMVARAHEFAKEGIAGCQDSSSDKDDIKMPFIAPLVNGQIYGTLEIRSTKAEVRMGLVSYSLSYKKCDHCQQFEWNEFTALSHLVDAFSINSTGAFHFDNLGEAGYTIILLADPAAIPADHSRVIVRNPPGRIELNKDHPIADLGTIVIEVLPDAKPP